MDILSYGIEQGIKQGIEQGIVTGKITGKIEGILELLEDFGPIPDELKHQIQEQKDLEVLKRWHKAAAKSDSIEAFIQQLSK